MEPMRDGERRGWIAYGAIFAPLLLLLVVTVMTWRAERRYAAVAKRVVHDYAAIAAWQYSRRANTMLHDEAMAAFRAISMGHQRQSHDSPLLPSATILSDRADTGATFLANARFAFTFDARARRLLTSARNIDPRTRAMLQRRLLSLAGSARRDDEPHRVLFDTSAGATHAIALWTLSAPDMPMRGAYGVVADASALTPKLAQVVGETNLLPATTTGAKLTADDLAIRLTRPNGLVVFATSNEPGETAATDTSGLRLSELRATVDIPPHVAGPLLVGAAPGSQLRSLALMLVIAAALAVLGLRHERRARELARLRSRFVANVSHELRTPLAQISMFAETLTLGRARTVAERTKFASIILTEARRLTALVESVLRFSRGESAGTKLTLERMPLRAEIESALDAFGPIAEQAEAKVRLDGSPNIHAALDRGAFRQVILNLLDNAIKHGGRGATVDISLVESDRETRVIVDDSGPGVPAEWRERIFEPFVRLELSKVPGAGIGLSVVRDLVKALGARVWVEDSPRGGARFIVALPYVASPVPRASRPAVRAGV